MTDNHRTAVEETLARLEADYETVLTRTTEWRIDHETYEQTWERAAAGTVGGTGAAGRRRDAAGVARQRTRRGRLVGAGRETGAG